MSQQDVAERIIRLALDFAEARVGHDGKIKSDAGEVRAFAAWVVEHGGHLPYACYEEGPEPVAIRCDYCNLPAAYSLAVERACERHASADLRRTVAMEIRRASGYDMDAEPLLRRLLERDDLRRGVKADIEVALADVEQLRERVDDRA